MKTRLAFFQKISLITCLINFLIFSCYLGYNYFNGSVLTQLSTISLHENEQLFKNYDFLNPTTISFLYTRDENQTIIVHRNGQIQYSPESLDDLIHRININKNFIEGTYQRTVAYANSDDIVLYEWNYILTRTNLIFSELTGHSFYFEEERPSDLIEQISGIGREYIMHCKSKDQINILHLTTCSQTQPCGCTYFKGTPIACSCQSAKKIKEKLEEIQVKEND